MNYDFKSCTISVSGGEGTSTKLQKSLLEIVNGVG
jgi:hypothetical protein